MRILSHGILSAVPSDTWLPTVPSFGARRRYLRRHYRKYVSSVVSGSLTPLKHAVTDRRPGM